MSSVAYVFSRIKGMTSTDVFEGADALDRAHAFTASVRPDFPAGIFAIGANPEAIAERKARIGRDLGMEAARAAEWAGWEPSSADASPSGGDR